MRQVLKPWGYETWLHEDDEQYVFKLIVLYGGERLSLQRHKLRHETMLVIEGIVQVQLGEETHTYHQGAVWEIPAGMVHRVTNLGQLEHAVIAEASGPYQPGDIERLADDYGRVGMTEETHVVRRSDVDLGRESNDPDTGMAGGPAG